MLKLTNSGNNLTGESMAILGKLTWNLFPTLPSELKDPLIDSVWRFSKGDFAVHTDVSTGKENGDFAFDAYIKYIDDIITVESIIMVKCYGKECNVEMFPSPRTLAFAAYNSSDNTEKSKDDTTEYSYEDDEWETKTYDITDDFASTDYNLKAISYTCVSTILFEMLNKFRTKIPIHYKDYGILYAIDNTKLFVELEDSTKKLPLESLPIKDILDIYFIVREAFGLPNLSK